MQSPLRFAHFEVLTRSDGTPLVLGQGAMGITYKALDANLLSLAVVKVLTPECQSVAAVRQRFLQEAQMMARLRHPHVASVFFYGDSATGAFYAMEFCEGASLQDYVAENGPLPWTDAFRFGLQAASALQALHAHDLIHRDLKPSNIILTTNLSTGVHLKLIDFGVAREGQRPDSGGLTQSGFIGTPAYASPEQLLESASLDVRSDFYALGAVLWFCLTGRPVFEGSAFDVMFHHVNTEPDWTKLPVLPEAALSLLKRLLAKPVEDRPAGPAVLLEELQSILGDGTIGSVQLRLTGKQVSKDLGGYEPIEEAGSDAFGKVWRARDQLTGRTVSLRVLSPEVASKSALVLRMQRLSAFVRPLEHARWQQVWHFEQRGKECRLATEWVDGPTLLTLLKARQTLPLADVAPLLAQIADAMDFAASKGLVAVETAPERVPIWVEGWVGMLQSEQAKWLRHPVASWPAWSVKVCPLRLSHAAQDYVLPTDTEAAQSITRIASDFVVLCCRLMTGQGKGTGGYVPSPALTSEGNAFFERYMGTPATPNYSCQHLLRMFCEAEGVSVPGAVDSQLGIASDPMATLPVAQPVARRSSNDKSKSSTSGIYQVAARTVASLRLKELEQRRLVLEQDAEKLAMDERLEAERDWLAREREALDGARRKVAEDEVARARRVAEAEGKILERKLALDQQEDLLEEKRREQQQLEHELQQRAQLEFQKLQESVQARESDFEKQKTAAERSLKQREAEFMAREQESLARIEALKAEAAALEAGVHQEQLHLQNTQLEETRRHQEEKAVGSLAKEKISAEARRLEELRKDLDVRLAEWKVVRRKRTITYAILALCGVVLAAVAAYFIKGHFVDIRTLPGKELWDKAAQERSRARQEKDWPGLLNMSVLVDQELKAQPDLAETLRQHQSDLTGDADAAVSGLLQQTSLPDITSDAGRKLLDNLVKAGSWNLAPEYRLLLAKLRMPDAAARGAGAEAMEVYEAAVNARSTFAHELQSELDGVVRQLEGQLQLRKLVPTSAFLETVDRVARAQPQHTSEMVRFEGELLAEQARRGGKPEDALRFLLETVDRNPAWANSLRQEAIATVDQLLQLPSTTLFGPLTAKLRSAADVWRLPAPYMVLAPLEADLKVRQDDYERAEEFGSMKAKALLGRLLLDQGISDKNAGLAKQGETKLREAVAAGEPEGMVLLAEALYAGRGMNESAREALQLAKAAEAQGHPDAFFLVAKAQFRLGELEHDPQQIEEAAKLFEAALAKNLRGAAYFLYGSNWNAIVKHPDKAAAALEKGAKVHDADCLYLLGTWATLGQAPVQQNVSRGRTLIEEASRLGSDRAKNWLAIHPP